MAKKSSGGGGANWMDTYGDMVTLLLCFFIMLYSMSSLDQNKWQALVQALNPDVQPEEVDEDALESVLQGQLTQEQVDADIETLYQTIQQYVVEENLTSQIGVTKGSGYVFISFDDTVFFAGDEYDLLDEGKEVLDKVAMYIAEVSSSVDEIQVVGHTAQADANRPNRPQVDRFLATNRAAEVTVYLQEKNIIDPARLVSIGYGQWRPIADNATSEGRAQNRRVELLVTGLDPDSEIGDNITQYYSMRSGEDGGSDQGSGQETGSQDSARASSGQEE